MPRFFAAAASLLLCLSFAHTASASEAVAAKTFVDSLAQQVLAIAQDNNLDSSEKTSKIETLFSNKVDIHFVAKFALGQYWRQASETQRADYVAAYKPFILKNYANRLTRYSGETYSLTQARHDRDAEVVTMAIHDPNGQNIMVDYRIRGVGDKMQIIDIVVEGVSLLTTQRSEFRAITDQKGVDGLIDILKSKVASQS